MIQSLYPNQLKNSEDYNFELTAKLWQRLFADEPYTECARALMEYACLNKYMPHPSDIKDLVAKFKSPEAYKSPEIAWEECCKAIKRFGYYRQNEAFATFDSKMKRVVKAVGWGNLCHSERIDVIKKNFFDMWKNINVSEQERLKLPYESTMKRIHELAAKDELR